MKLNNRQIVELIGVTAVVASLMFVGMQLMLDRQAALSEQYGSRAESIKSDIRARLESDSFMQLRAAEWERGIRPAFWTEEIDTQVKDRQLSGRDVHALQLSIRMQYYQYDNLYYQYINGFIEEEFWLGVRALIIDSFRDPLFRGIFASRRDYHPIDEVIAEILIEMDGGV